MRRGIPVFQPEKARHPDAVARIAAEAPDLIVVVAYGHILPKTILDIPRLGCINVHASLLPKYRGAAPINWAVARGETVTGITIMRMDEGMDTGPMLHVREMPIGEEDTAETMFSKLSIVGAEALREALRKLREGTLDETPQDAALATYAPMLKKEHGRIDWSRPAGEIRNLVRGMTPWPSAFALHAGKTLKVLSSAVAAESAPAGEPGEFVALGRDGISVACGKGSSAFGSFSRRGERRWTRGRTPRAGAWRRGNGYRKGRGDLGPGPGGPRRGLRRHRARPRAARRGLLRFPRPGAPDGARDGDLAPARHDRFRPSAVPLPSPRTDRRVRPERPPGGSVPALLHPHPRPRGTERNGGGGQGGPRRRRGGVRQRGSARDRPRGEGSRPSPGGRPPPASRGGIGPAGSYRRVRDVAGGGGDAGVPRRVPRETALRGARQPVPCRHGCVGEAIRRRRERPRPLPVRAGRIRPRKARPGLLRRRVPRRGVPRHGRGGAADRPAASSRAGRADSRRLRRPGREDDPPGRPRRRGRRRSSRRTSPPCGSACCARW